MKKVIAALAMVVSFGAHADPAPTTLSENFDSGLGSFSTFNASIPPQGPGWFDGNTGIFGPQAGAGYAAANFEATSSLTGSIAAWLIGPELTFIGQTVSFYARTADLGFLDSLTVMVGTGGSTDIKDFQALFTIEAGTLTDAWELFSTVLGTTGSGRIAFLYSVGNALDADYVGLDTVRVAGGGTPVPEPASLALLGLGLGLIILVRRRRHSRAQ